MHKNTCFSSPDRLLAWLQSSTISVTKGLSFRIKPGNGLFASLVFSVSRSPIHERNYIALKNVKYYFISIYVCIYQIVYCRA